MKRKKEFELKWWHLFLIGFILYVSWIGLALADVSGNPFGVNSGKIETYLNVINKTGYNAEQYVRLFEVGEDYDFVMKLIERDFRNLDEYESNLTKYGVGEREDIKWKLGLARMQVQSARGQIYSLILKANYPGLNNFQLQEKAREWEEAGIFEPYKSFLI